MGHRDIRRTEQSLLDHVATRVQVDTVTGRYRYMVRQHRDVTEVWGGSLMEWLKEAGYGIYVHGARVKTGWQGLSKLYGTSWRYAIYKCGVT